MQIKVAIVDDDEGIRSGLSALIKRAKEFKLLGEYANGETALKEIPALQPDVVIMDINLPGMKGYDCVRQIKSANPAIQFLMLTVYEDTENIFNALAAGAAGYLLKRTKSAELLEAIREVHRGGSPMTTHIARKVTQSFHRAGPSSQPTENLSEREQEVLDCLSQGFLYKEIAEKLGISYETVHTYIRRIYEKLQVRTRTEAVAKFLKR